MNQKDFNVGKDAMESLVGIEMGFCLATDKIMVLGEKIDYMYRDEPDSETDSGWRFLSNTEDQEYLDNPENSGIYSLNTVANNDRAIIPYLNAPIGSELVRIEGTDEFVAN